MAIWKRASTNSCKILIAIQRSDQKLWPVRTVTLAWRDQTSSSSSIDSTSYIWKRHLETHIKFWSRPNGRIQSYGPFEPLLLPGTTRPRPHRVSIIYPLYGKGHPQTHVKFWSRSNNRIKRYGPFEPLLLPGATRPRPHRVTIPHPLYGKGHPQTRKILIAI